MNCAWKKDGVKKLYVYKYIMKENSLSIEKMYPSQNKICVQFAFLNLKRKYPLLLYKHMGGKPYRLI